MEQHLPERNHLAHLRLPGQGLCPGRHGHTLQHDRRLQRQAGCHQYAHRCQLLLGEQARLHLPQHWNELSAPALRRHLPATAGPQRQDLQVHPFRRCLHARQQRRGVCLQRHQTQSAPLLRPRHRDYRRQRLFVGKGIQQFVGRRDLRLPRHHQQRRRGERHHERRHNHHPHDRQDQQRLLRDMRPFRHLCPSHHLHLRGERPAVEVFPHTAHRTAPHRTGRFPHLRPESRPIG